MKQYVCSANVAQIILLCYRISKLGGFTVRLETSWRLPKYDVFSRCATTKPTIESNGKEAIEYMLGERVELVHLARYQQGISRTSHSRPRETQKLEGCRVYAVDHGSFQLKPRVLGPCRRHIAGNCKMWDSDLSE